MLKMYYCDFVTVHGSTHTNYLLGLLKIWLRLVSNCSKRRQRGGEFYTGLRERQQAIMSKLLMP